MSATITGLGSGFDINSWVSQLVAVKQSSTLTPLQTKLNTLQTKSTALNKLQTKFSTLQTSLQAFTNTIYDSSNDMWTNTKIESSASKYATATSTGHVSASNVNLEIEQVATATVAKSANSLGTVSKEALNETKFTNLANGQAEAGNFSMFLNGKEYKIEIKEDDTLGDVIKKINENTDGKIQANLDEYGNFSISAYKESTDNNGQTTFVKDTNAELVLGSSADTSNFVSALKLFEKNGTHEFTSPYAVSKINTSAAMKSTDSGLGEIRFYDEEGNPATSGKIFINGAEIEINEETTLNNLISKINSNSDTNVKATYDALTNRIILTSTETGQNNISLSSEGTNLLNVLGLTQGEGEDEVILKDSQTLGQNAIAYINGNRVVSTSNTITGETSGISNLSIKIMKPTGEYSDDEEAPKEVSLDIQADHTKIKEALKTFVNAYNDVISTTKTMTTSDGDIGRDASLSSILSTVRSLTSTLSSNEGEFTMLAQIGISTSKTDITSLSIDDKKLEKALNENFESVKLLLSDGYTSKENNGLFDKLLDNVSSILDVEKGYFANQKESVQNSIKNVNSRIDTANERLLNYEALLTKQFNAMDNTISSLSAQLSTFQSYFG